MVGRRRWKLKEGWCRESEELVPRGDEGDGNDQKEERHRKDCLSLMVNLETVLLIALNLLVEGLRIFLCSFLTDLER